MRALLCGSLAAAVICNPSSAAAADTWYQPPYLLHAGDVPLDTATSLNKEQFSKRGKENASGNFVGDTLGHAAPWWADVTGRGVKDLVVGAFGGGFRLYRNLGTHQAPRFPKEYEFLKGGDEYAQVHIHCCIASNPRFVDLTGDGLPDLMSGNWFNGELAWWKALGNGALGPKQELADAAGNTLYVDPPPNPKDAWKYSQNFAAVGYPVDWFGDGKMALLMGTVDGRLLVRRNANLEDRPAFSNKNDYEILIDGKGAMPDHHASPIVADWDGDGLWDIISGSMSGKVYYFRNTGKPGAPRFKTREILIEGGQAEQWVERGQYPRRGIRSYPQAVDFNGDGKLDLLLGDFSQTMTPREGLTEVDEKQMRALKARLEALDKRTGFDQTDIRGRSRAYGHSEDPTAAEELTALLDELAPYLQLYQLNRFESLTPLCSHGLIWVYLRK